MLDLSDIFQRFIDPWVENFIEKFANWNKESIEADDVRPHNIYCRQLKTLI